MSSTRILTSNRQAIGNRLEDDTDLTVSSIQLWTDQKTTTHLVVTTRDSLRIYSLDPTTSSFRQHFESTEFNSANISDKFLPHLFSCAKFQPDPILIVLTIRGFLFARFTISNLQNPQTTMKPVGWDTLFAKLEASKYDLFEWARFFGSTGPLGLFARNKDGQVKLFGLNENALTATPGSKSPILELDANKSLTTEWKNPTSVYFFQDMLSNGTTNIIRLDSISCLSIYSFNEPNRPLQPTLILKSTLLPGKTSLYLRFSLY